MFSKNKAWLLTMIIAIFVLAGCSEKDKASEAEGFENPDYPSDVKENPIVTITMENDKKIIIELEPKTAPNSVANFIELAQDGFYDGLIFHRVIPGFMIQGGDPSGNGTGGPDYAIAGEFASNDFENKLSHDRGVLSMARSQDKDSAGSQFFIMTDKADHLDGDYAAFGKVLEGLEVVDEIVAAERDAADKPKADQKMKTVKVDTKGYDYPAAIKIK